MAEEGKRIQGNKSRKDDLSPALPPIKVQVKTPSVKPPKAGTK